MGILYRLNVDRFLRVCFLQVQIHLQQRHSDCIIFYISYDYAHKYIHYFATSHIYNDVEIFSINSNPLVNPLPPS